MTIQKSILYAILVLTVSTAVAESAIPQKYAQIVSVFHNKFPDEKITNIQESPIDGIYEVMIPPHIYYANSNATYVFSGDIFKLADEKNITQDRRQIARKTSIDMLDTKSMIVFPAEKNKYTISVFTDIECAYCRKLHSQIGEYNKLGITVRYLAFPRGGPASDSFTKAISVWCAKDRRKALTDAKNDIVMEKRTCDSPVLKHYNLGKKFGIQGTPTIVLENGYVIPGYVSPEKLLSEIKNRSPLVNIARVKNKL